MKEESIERWTNYVSHFGKNEHVKGWMVAIVDDIDSFAFYGGVMGKDIKTAKELLSKILIMRNDLKRYIKTLEKAEI